MSALPNFASLAGWKGYAASALVGVVVLGAAGAWVRWYGGNQYQAGADAKQAEIEKRQAAIERVWQEGSDRADAKYRGAVLARQQMEEDLGQAERDRDAAFARIDGLREQLARRGTTTATSGGRPDGASTDWIGLFGECLARAESLGHRLGKVGKDAARWADQVNGLQGHIHSLGIPTPQ